MSTASLSRLRVRVDPRNAAVAALLAAWAVAAVALSIQAEPGPARHAVVIGVPLALIAARLLRRNASPALDRLAAATAVVAGAILAARVIEEQPAVAAGAPFVLWAALLVRRRPGWAVVIAFLLAGWYGSLQAFASIPAGQVIDVLLVALWLLVAIRLVLARNDRALRITPAILLIGAYVVFTLAELAFTDDVEFGLRSFRLTTWHLLVFVPIAYMSWRRFSPEAVAHACAVAALTVAGYAALRWGIGPAAKEQALLGGSYGVQYNQLFVGEDKVQGSFPNGQELGLWCSLMIPFLVAAAIAWRGPIRLVAVAAAPLCVIGLLGSGQRTGLIGAVIGTGVVLVLNQMARGLRGPRLGIAGAALVAVVVGAIAVFPAVVDTPAKVERYKNILTPSRDVPFQTRLQKWRNAFSDIRGRPFGRGIGEGSPQNYRLRFRGNASDNVDNSYVQIAYEQGPAGMLLFIVALLALLIELVRHAVWTRAPGGTALTMAAAGTLTAVMIAYAGNLHINSLAQMAGWIVIGLGVSQLTTRTPASSQPA